MTLLYVILLIVTICFILYFTGRRKRKYDVLNPDEKLNFKNQEMSVKDLAKLYQPILYHVENLRGFDPRLIYYEVVDNGSLVFLNYYPLWLDEIHPVKIIHFIYRFYRKLYYGSPADIEFIQLKVDKTSGKILELNAESDSHNNPDCLISDHIKFSMQLKENSLYRLSLGDKVKDDLPLPIEENRIKILVITWNHLYGYFDRKIGKEFRDLPLEYLDEKIYLKYKMCRRGSPMSL